MLVTTAGGPGLASTNHAFLMCTRALLEFDVGSASAGGVIAIILANIVAIFLVRAIARNLELRAGTMHHATRDKIILTIVGWLVAAMVFFPIFWMFLTSFKTEVEAVSTPPTLFSSPTLENYDVVQQRAAYFRFAANSVIVSVGSTLLALALAIPAAYAMACFPKKRPKDVLLWMLSTKMLPPVSVLVPMYLIFRDLGPLDTRIGLTVVSR